MTKKYGPYKTQHDASVALRSLDLPELTSEQRRGVWCPLSQCNCKINCAALTKSRWAVSTKGRGGWFVQNIESYCSSPLITGCVEVET